MPAAFLANYGAASDFLSALERRCTLRSDLEAFRAAPAVDAFLKRWKLSVYFSLRFQARTWCTVQQPSKELHSLRLKVLHSAFCQCRRHQLFRTPYTLASSLYLDNLCYPSRVQCANPPRLVVRRTSLAP